MFRCVVFSSTDLSRCVLATNRVFPFCSLYFAFVFFVRREVPLQLAFSYVEEVMRCSDFALELSEARWRILQHPAQLLVSLTEARAKKKSKAK